MRDIEISNAARSLIDAPYSLGDPESGFDCVSMIWHFYSSLDPGFVKDFPEAIKAKGFTAGNYAEKWKAGEGREELYDYLMSLGEPVGVNYIIGGDLLIFQSERWAFPGIYLGSNHFLAAFEKGCMCVPFKMFKHALVGVRRLLNKK